MIRDRDQDRCVPLCIAGSVLVLAAAALSAAADGSREEFGTGPVFEVAGPETGLDFVHFNGMSGELYFPEMVGPGAAFFDFDDDGDLDVYLVQGRMLGPGDPKRALFPPPGSGTPQDRLFRNDLQVSHDGVRILRFTDVTVESGIRSREYGMGVATGDFNNDGRIDLYVTNFGPNRMFLNRGDGTFEDVTARLGIVREFGGALGVDAGDFDGDGDEDLIVAHLHRETHTLYRDQGGGLFRDATATSGIGPASWEATGFGTVWLDLDNDGDLDLFVANGAVKLKEALVRANDPHPLHEPNQLFLNEGGGRLREISHLGGLGVTASEIGRGVAVGDVDNDGDADLLVLNNSGPARLLLNQIGHERHWLGLRLTGPAKPGGGGGRDLLGAWVALERRGQPTLWRRSRTGGGYASARDPRVLFGLGDKASAVKVRVRWPDGSPEEWSLSEIDRYVTLRRGSGKPPSPAQR